MTHLTWIDSTNVNPENLNKMAQDADLAPAASTFAGSDGRTITHNYGHTAYQVNINPTADPAGFLGEVWVSKAANTVVIYNSGSARGAFDYVILPHA
ncbi:MAG: hypothetical protein JRD89_07255 [Deltaproteobacteria bacterium]|nr:hypothetical protein [Deltaproteobacteria bacterium]